MFLKPLGVLLGFLGLSWEPLGTSWGDLGPSWGEIGVILGDFWDTSILYVLVVFWVCLGSSFRGSSFISQPLSTPFGGRLLKYCLRFAAPAEAVWRLRCSEAWRFRGL